MKRFIEFLILTVVFFGGAGSHKAYVAYHHPLKHTWDCRFIARPSTSSFWFVRPNGEMFEMFFDNPPYFPVAVFRDIAYTDDNAYMQHFVRATVKQGQ